MKKDKKNCYFVRYEQLQFNDRLTYMHTYGHGDSMTEGPRGKKMGASTEILLLICVEKEG